MKLLILGAGMGIVGGLVPSPLHLISLTQVALDRWRRAITILVGPPLLIDGALLVVTLFFFRYVPHNIAHYVAYAGGIILLLLGGFSLYQMRAKSRENLADSDTLTYASVIAASLTELSSPGTWIYWLTIAGPILAEGKRTGYWHVAPFFIGGLVGYYGASIFSVWLISWGASLHKSFKARLMLAANVLLILLGIGYLANAIYFAK
ncbi:MAG: LysE family transporter [Acidobacteriota bacterium]|nr:LysE family transporter [Acidobacteriota bacterium]